MALFDFKQPCNWNKKATQVKDRTQLKIKEPGLKGPYLNSS